MHIAIDIPDTISGVIAPEQDPARATLEALALEGYRSRRLGESAVRRLLGFQTRMDALGGRSTRGEIWAIKELYFSLPDDLFHRRAIQKFKGPQYSDALKRSEAQQIFILSHDEIRARLNRALQNPVIIRIVYDFECSRWLDDVRQFL